MNRRDFLAGLSAVPLALRAASRSMSRIAVSTWSLHPYFKATRRSVPGKPLDLKLPDFFRLAQERWGVTNYEIVSVHFDSKDWEYLTDMRKALSQVGGKVYNIPCDIARTNLSDDDPEKRAASVAAVKEWIDAAVFMGSPSIRCNTGASRKDPNNV